MRSEHELLYVRWQDQATRRWFAVARLETSRTSEGDDEYVFRYVRGVEKAGEHGFKPFLAFPNLSETVRSRELPPFFRNRLMPTSRPDYGEYVAQLGLDPTSTGVTILGRSGGRRVTEQEEIEVVAPPVKDGDVIKTLFFIHGMRHVKPSEETVSSLGPEEPLSCTPDPENPVNADAVRLSRADGRWLGYVPDYLCADIARLMRADGAVTVTVEQVNPPTVPVQRRVLCRLEANAPADFRPLATPDFEPLDAQGVTKAA